MELSIRQAVPQDIETVVEILSEAALWLQGSGMAMWRQDELLPHNVAADIHAALFFLAVCDGEPAGTIRYQLDDPLFWPDVPQDDSAFVHRLAVRRRFAGGEVSSALLHWALRARTLSAGVISVWIARHRARACERFMNVWGFFFTAIDRLDPTSLRDMSAMSARRAKFVRGNDPDFREGTSMGPLNEQTRIIKEMRSRGNT